MPINTKNLNQEVMCEINKSPRVELIFDQGDRFIKTNHPYSLAAGILNSDASATYR
jgi:hypothetical protein